MVKPLDSKGRKKWYGYLTELNNDPDPTPLTESQVKSYLEGWKGHRIDPEKKSLTPTIDSVWDNHLMLKSKNDNIFSCTYREIIDSEKVIRYWLKEGMAPESKDFKNPDPAIQIKKISRNSYAPALAERIRKQLNIDRMIPPEVRILPMSPNEFKGENLNSISDVQEKFILGVLISEERNGAYWYRRRTLNAPEGSVVLFQFDSHIIGSGVFLHSQAFSEPRGEHKGKMVFDVNSLKTFKPLGRENIEEFWPSFNKFSQAFQKLQPEGYIDFVASLSDVKFGSGNETINKALSFINWRQGGKYYCLNATSGNKWVGFQESVILKLRARYGNDFFLVIWSNKNIEYDFYNIPFNKVENLFIDEYKTKGHHRHRWTATIRNNEFRMRDNSHLAVDVSDDYGNMHTEDKIERTVRGDLSAFEYEDKHFNEGEKKYRYTSFYERDPKLRIEAVRFHGKDGVRCKVCGFDFEATYGSRGEGFIEVHHLKPVSSLGESTEVIPETDMVLLCSNCHRMIHRKRNEILTPEEMQKLLKKNS